MDLLIITIQNSAKSFSSLIIAHLREIQNPWIRLWLARVTSRCSRRLSRWRYRWFTTVFTALRALDCVRTVNSLLQFTLTHPTCRYSVVPQMLASHSLKSPAYIRMDHQEVGCGYMNWIGLAQDRDRWRTLVSAVMNLRVPWNAGNFLTSCKPVSCSGRTAPWSKYVWNDLYSSPNIVRVIK